MGSKSVQLGILFLLYGLLCGCVAATCREIARQDECQRILNNQRCAWDADQKLCVGSPVTGADCGVFYKQACEQAKQVCLWKQDICVPIPFCKAAGRKPAGKCASEASEAACLASASVGTAPVCRLDPDAAAGAKCVYDVSEAIRLCGALDEAHCNDANLTNGFCEWQ